MNRPQDQNAEAAPFDYTAHLLLVEDFRSAIGAEEKAAAAEAIAEFFGRDTARATPWRQRAEELRAG